jgi:hypothetical protein
LPQSGNPPRGDPNTVPRSAAEYGYVNGKILGSPGYMRVTVSQEKVTAELVRSYLPEQENAGRKNHDVAFSSTIRADGKPLPASPPR